jgi:preprotein translocase subunit SecE
MKIINFLSRKFENIKLFFKEVYIEAKKIDWPSRNETIRYTLIVITISISVAIYLGGLDFVFMKIIGRFFI